jgi:tetratricopeptide (TPR) repeat protein
MKQITWIFFLALSIQLASYGQRLDLTKYENVVSTGVRNTTKDGSVKLYYQENGISVTCSINYLNLYGKYFAINLEIENLTGKSFLFNPSDIVSYLTVFKIDRKTKIVSTKEQFKGRIVSYDDYYKKINNQQNWQSFLNAFGESYNAQMAARSTSVTTTSISGYSNSYGSIYDYYGKVPVTTNYSSRGTYGGSATSVTNTYNGAVAYAANQIAEKKIQKFDEQLYKIKSEINQGYLKLNTIEHGERMIGTINLLYTKTDQVELLIPVNGKYYYFVFSDNPQALTKDIFIEEVLSSNKSVNTYFKQANSKYNNKEYQGAIDILNDALKLEENVQLFKFRALLYEKHLNNNQAAINDYNKIINMEPLIANHYIERGRLYKLNKNTDKANQDFDKAISLEPKEIIGYFERALLNGELKRHEKSIADYERIIAISNSKFNATDNLGVVYNNMGYSYVQLAEYDKALPLINKALELMPNHDYVWGSRGELYYKRGEYKKAIADLTKSIDLYEKGDTYGNNTSQSLPYFNRANSLIKLNKIKDACLDLNKAIKLGNSDAAQVSKQYCN